MTDALPYVLEYYDKEIVKMMCEKYGFPPLTALRKFLFSETYRMLSNPELEMWDFSPTGIFDMWESEQITGNPRQSLYLRRD